jgi:hypothetical protein
MFLVVSFQRLIPEMKTRVIFRAPFSGACGASNHLADSKLMKTLIEKDVPLWEELAGKVAVSP